MRLGALVVRQGVFFALVGALASATHVAAALSAAALGLAPMRANLVGYACAVGVSYLGNARMTFRTPALRRAQFVRFVIVSLLALGLNQAIVHVLVVRLGWPFPYALAVVVVAVAAFSFTLSKLWAFRPAQAAG